jgi:hypothetical protein
MMWTGGSFELDNHVGLAMISSQESAGNAAIRQHRMRLEVPYVEINVIQALNTRCSVFAGRHVQKGLVIWVPYVEENVGRET